MSDISEKEAAKIFLSTIFWTAGYVCATLPLIYLGWDLLYCSETIRLDGTILVQLAGNFIIFITCFFTEENWLAKYIKILHGIPCYAAGTVIIRAAIYGFPDYSKFWNLKSVVVVTICLIAIISFVMCHNNYKDEKLRANWWR